MPKSFENDPILRRDQRKVITALLAYKTRAKAAEKSGIHRATIRRWFRKDAWFREQFNKACDAVFEGSLCTIKAASAEAVERLRKLVQSKDERVAIEAIKEILASGHDAHLALRARHARNAVKSPA